jgi:hypothetical protein
MKDGVTTERGAEVVNFRMGGVGKMILTDGMDKGHTNGQIKGPHSKTGDLATGIHNCYV